MKLFGLYLTPLYFAIATVESERGATSSNVYQIRNIYVEDVNRIMEKPGCRYFPPFRLTDPIYRDMAEDMMRVYWLHWGTQYERKAHKPVDYEVLARIHNGGPFGWKKPETVDYWNRVKRVLVTMDAADAERWMDNKRQGDYKKFFPNNK